MISHGNMINNPCPGFSCLSCQQTVGIEVLYAMRILERLSQILAIATYTGFHQGFSVQN